MGWVFCRLGSSLGRKLKLCKNYARMFAAEAQRRRHNSSMGDRKLVKYTSSWFEFIINQLSTPENPQKDTDTVKIG